MHGDVVSISLVEHPSCLPYLVSFFIPQIWYQAEDSREKSLCLAWQKVVRCARFSKSRVLPLFEERANVLKPLFTRNLLWNIFAVAMSFRQPPWQTRPDALISIVPTI